MVTQTAQIKNGTIPLPSQLRKVWKGANIFIFPDKNNDTLVIKRIQPSLETEWNKYEEKLKKNKNKIPSKIIKEAVRWAKSQSE